MKPTQEEINCLVHNTTYARLLCLNDVKARLYLPVTIFLALLIVVGTIGNTVVCLVYIRRRTRVSSHYFILALAALDLMTCVVGLPTEIADLLLPYTFESPWACKVLRFIHSSTIIASSTILIQVAFDRYYRICQLGRQFTANKAKFLCVGAVILGFICSWPTFLLFGRKTVTRRLGGNILKGTDCTTDDSMRRTIYPTIYYIFLFSLFGITVVFFAVLYSKIGLTILKRKRFTTSGSVNSPPATPKGLKRTGSRKAHVPDLPSMELSSGQEEGQGNSTASSGSSGSSGSDGSGGSNFSNTTATTTVSSTFYGNLRRFCGYKKDVDGNHVWSGPIIAAESDKHCVKRMSDDKGRCSVRGSNHLHHLSTVTVLEDLSDDSSCQNTPGLNGGSDQERGRTTSSENDKNIMLAGNGAVSSNSNNVNNAGSNSNRNGISNIRNSDNISNSNNINNSNSDSNSGNSNISNNSSNNNNSSSNNSIGSNQRVARNDPDDNDDSPITSRIDRETTTFSSIRIKTTPKTRIYVSTKTQTPISSPNASLPLDHHHVTRKGLLPVDQHHLQDHVQESEDEERLENAHNNSQIHQQNQEQNSKRSSQRQIRVGKTTTVLFAVTLAYILSFLPYLTVMVMRSIIKDLEENLSPVGELAYKLCVKSFFINNAINPIIYSFLNQAFRQDAKLMFSRTCGKFGSSQIGRTLPSADAI